MNTCLQRVCAVGGGGAWGLHVSFSFVAPPPDLLLTACELDSRNTQHQVASHVMRWRLTSVFVISDSSTCTAAVAGPSIDAFESGAGTANGQVLCVRCSNNVLQGHLAEISQENRHYRW